MPETAPAAGPPTGIVTFVFAAIDRAADLRALDAGALRAAKRAHDALVRAASARHGGYEVESTVDSVYLLFSRASDAIRFAVDLARDLGAHPWPPQVGALSARVSMHTGELHETTGDRFGGPAANLAARLLGIARGGEVVVSETTRVAAKGNLSREVTFLDLGTHTLVGFDEPEHLFGVRHPDMPTLAPVEKAASLELRPGMVIDERYEVVRRLGRGGMGSVFLVRHNLLDKELALKVIAPEMQGDQTFRHRFIREAKAAMEFVHRHAVPVRSFGVTREGLCYMTLDYVRGTSLTEAIERDGVMDPERACRILRMLLEALGEAHRSRIIHRDLKPDNVMIEERDGREIARILDFGLAKVLSDDGGLALTGAFTVMGTPAYMSPEQACGMPLDQRSDIYACGLLLFQMLAGRLPFDGRTAEEVMTKHVNDPPPRPSSLGAILPPGLDEVVLTALAKSPDERYQTAEDFHDALGLYVQGDDGSAPSVRIPGASSRSGIGSVKLREQALARLASGSGAPGPGGSFDSTELTQRDGLASVRRAPRTEHLPPVGTSGGEDLILLTPTETTPVAPSAAAKAPAAVLAASQAAADQAAAGPATADREPSRPARRRRSAVRAAFGPVVVLLALAAAAIAWRLSTTGLDLAAEAESASALAARLVAEQRRDGGFADHRDDTADAWVSADAIAALLVLDPALHAQAIETSLRRLTELALAHDVGLERPGFAGFPRRAYADNVASIEATAAVGVALALAQGRAATDTKALARETFEYLLRVQNGDGSWSSLPALGMEGATTGATASALRAIVGLGAALGELERASTSALRAARWLASVYNRTESFFEVNPRRRWGSDRNVPGLSDEAALALCDARALAGLAGKPVESAITDVLAHFAASTAKVAREPDAIARPREDDYDFEASLRDARQRFGGVRAAFWPYAARLWVAEVLARDPTTPEQAAWEAERRALRRQVPGLAERLRAAGTHQVAATLLAVAAARSAPAGAGEGPLLIHLVRR